MNQFKKKYSMNAIIIKAYVNASFKKCAHIRKKYAVIELKAFLKLHFDLKYAACVKSKSIECVQKNMRFRKA